MVFICGQRKPKANAPGDFFFSDGYVNYLTSVIGKVSQTNLPLSLCSNSTGVKIHFSRFWSEKLRRHSPPLMEFQDSTSALFTSLLLPAWTHFGRYTGMPGTRMLQDLPWGTQHLLRQPRVPGRKEHSCSQMLCSSQKVFAPMKNPHVPVGSRAQKWTVGGKMRFYFQCLSVYLVPDKQRRTQSSYRTLQLKWHQGEIWAWVPLLEINLCWGKSHKESEVTQIPSTAVGSQTFKNRCMTVNDNPKSSASNAERLKLC